MTFDYIRPNIYEWKSYYQFQQIFPTQRMHITKIYEITYILHCQSIYLGVLLLELCLI